MTILYAQNQQNTTGKEYLVIQRKLSEMKQSALEEGGEQKSDLVKSIQILEKAQKILQVQK